MDEKAIIAICLIGIIALCAIAVVAINPPQSLNKSLNVYIVNLLDGQVLAWDSASGNWTNVNQTGGGLPGSPGVNGTVWFTNSSAPSSGVGVDGDYFFNSLNGDVYQKVTGAWVLIGNLTGPLGPQGIQGIQGIQGATGANGSQGIQGIQGIQGDQGPAGVNGSTWHSGSGAPSSDLGTSGDYYLDIVSGNVYKKNGSWAVIGNIMGPQGAKGDKGDTGATGATGAQGIAGVNGTNGLNGTTLNQGLVGYWKFDENTGNIAVDNSGLGNTGTIYGASRIDGKYGKALSFDGSNDWVKLLDSPSLNPSYITLAVWLNVSSGVTGYGRLVDKGGTGGYLLSFGDAGAGRLRWIVTRASDSTYGLVDSPLGYNDNVFHYVISAWDGTTMRLLVDNVEVASTPFSGTLKTTTYNVGIASNYAGGENLACITDEARIYNRALTQAEMENLHTSNPLYYPVVPNSTYGFSISTPTFPASTIDVTNTNSYSVRIYILTIGTTTAYQITDQLGNAQSFSTVLMVGQEITLDSNAKIRFTYAVAPTWVWYGAG